MNLKDTYNRIAKDWVIDHKRDDWWVDGTDVFISYLKKDDLVLDIGCAGGTKSQYLIDHGMRVFGIDLSDEMIRIAREEVPGGTFQVMDLMSVDLLEQEFDGIICQAVLLHLPKQDTPLAVRKIAEKLKAGGYLHISVKEVREGQPNEEMKVENDYGYDYQRLFSYYSTDEIIKYLKDAGLEIVYNDITTSGRTRWIQVIAKK